MPFSMLDGTAGTVAQSAGYYSLNPFGAKDMSFEYQFSVTSGIVEHLSGASFLGYKTDVVQAIGAGPLGVAGTGGADSVTRTISGGNVVTWNYTTTGIGPGGVSYTLIVNTDATMLGLGSLGLLDGGSAQFAGFSPAADPAPDPAPEPASMILFLGTLAGLGGGAVYRRFRFRRGAIA
jgi:hypothetical protein